jgi:alkylation response protein AidB-like acyl-CoA dehydrogenase
MDFSFTEAQAAIADLARKLFTERATPAALKTMEAAEDRFHAPLWKELASLGLLGTAIPESDGGGGHGFLELCAFLQEVGGAVVPLPLWPTLALGALPIGKFGNAEQRARLLPAVARGETILTAALAEYGSEDPLRPSTAAKNDGAAWIVNGTKTCVPAARMAQRIVVGARTSAETLGVFLADPKSPGVKLERQVTTSGESQYEMTMTNVRISHDDVLGDPARGADVLAWLVPRATIALVAIELGVAERVLRMTASYTTTRQQFDRPIATFQAVAQRVADAYIDVESIRVATWQAAWRLSEELPATTEVSVAKFFASEAGHRVVYAAQHLHAGMGFDLDYPLYRYYLLSKQLELTLGSSATHLARIGAELSRSE